MLDSAAYALANGWQRGFPLVPQPFAAIAAKAALTEDQVLAKLRRLRNDGVIDRVGPVFRPNTVGASSLAAMAVPPERLDAIARYVSGQAGVNHNYQRGHRFNLWFVATAATEARVRSTLSGIEQSTGIDVLRLPLLEEYHIDLGFDLASHAAPRTRVPKPASRSLSPRERKVVAATANGLPLVSRPYEAVGSQAGLSEAQVLEGLGSLVADGRVRRIGAVVRHRSLGYRANAMAVWDVPDAQVGSVGAALAREPAITLCYRRARALPDWPYNLYCMVHGRERARVEEDIRGIAARHGLDHVAQAVLFSERCYSQKAAQYG